MACQVFVDAQRLLHLCVFVVGFNVWTILIRCKDVLQDVPAVAVVAVQVYIVGACSHVVDGQCVVSDIIAAVGSYGIATVALTIPAEVNTVELQLVGLVAVVDYLHTSVAWHHHLVPIVGVAMVVAVQIAQMALYGLAYCNLAALSGHVVRLRVVLVVAGREYVFQLVASVSIIAIQLNEIGAYAYICDGQRVVSDIIASVGSYGIAAVALTIPAEVNSVEFQIVGLVAIVNQIYATVPRHLNLVPVGNIADAVAIHKA